MNKYNRREIIKTLLCASAASSFSGANILLPNVAFAQPKIAEKGYKALVVLLMSGGNDAFNMIVPSGSDSDSGYNAYKKSRADLSVKLNNFGDPIIGRNAYAKGVSSDAASYLNGIYDFEELGIGVNALMPELAQLLRDKKATVVANVGTLVEPVTKSTLREVKIPPFLYAHNHQQRALETGWANNLNATGWAGRIAEQWQIGVRSDINKGASLGLNVSFGGQTRMMTSPNYQPVVLDPYGDSLFDANYGGFSADLFKELNSFGQSDPIQRAIRLANRQAVIISELLAESKESVDSFAELRDPYGNPLFSNPTLTQLQLRHKLSGDLLASAESAARILAFGKNKLNLNRQIIFIKLGGFDTHADQANQHPRLLRELSLALWSFQKAMESLGMSEEVALFTLSDFGRSLGNNGAGTDHGWGGHNLVVSGDINGQGLFGSIPDLRLGGESDTGSKGRMIPTIAIDQYLATLCHWFGLSDSENALIFPNLKNFRIAGSSEISTAYLSSLFKHS